MDNDGDGNEPLYSVDSGDEVDLAEHESRLYSLIHHSSDHLDSSPPTTSGKPSPDLRINPYVSASTLANIQPSSINSHQISPSTTLPNSTEKSPNFHQSIWNKASRLNNVHEIINLADRNKELNTKYKYLKDAISKHNINVSSRSLPDGTPYKSPLNANTKRNKNMKENPTQDNIKKTSGSTMVLNPKSSHITVNFSASIPDKPSTLINSFSFDLSTHTGNSTIDAGNIFDIPSEVASPPIFRLDNRLFSNAPFNLDSKIQESHNQFFSGLSTKNIQQSQSANNIKNKQDLLTSVQEIDVTSDEIIVIDIVKIAKREQLIKTIIEEVIILDDDSPTVSPINVEIKTQDSSKSLGINKVSITPDIIVLGCNRNVESDSDESICVLPSPKHSQPTVFNVEESSDDEAARMGPPVHPPPSEVDMEPQDNSFDFLDSSYDVDALAKSQARLLCNLIGSKESLIDERFFQPEQAPNNKEPQILVNSAIIRPQRTNRPNPANSKTPASSTSELATKQMPTNQTSLDFSFGGSFKTPEKPLQTKRSNIPKIPPESLQPEIMVIAEVTRSTPMLTDHPTPLRSPVVRPKMPNQVSNITSSTNVAPTLNIDPDLRDIILDYIDARSKGVPQAKARDSIGVSCTITGSTPQNSAIMKEDILAVHSGTITDNAAIDEILRDTTAGGSLSIEAETQTKQPSRAPKRKSKRKKPGSKKRQKLRLRLIGTSERRPAMANAVSYTKILGDPFVDKKHTSRKNPTSWTRHMKRFYNKSWGGEDFDVDDVKRTMSSNPSLWRVSAQDRQRRFFSRGNGNRCSVCQGAHHSLLCSYRTPSCNMCGTKGHTQDQCPDSICLQCGQPSARYVDHCHWCEVSNHGDCATCVWRHDPAKPCSPAPDNYQCPAQGYQLSMATGRQLLPAKRARTTPVKERTFDRRLSMNHGRPPFRPYWKNQFNRSARW